MVPENSDIDYWYILKDNTFEDPDTYISVTDTDVFYIAYIWPITYILFY